MDAFIPNPTVAAIHAFLLRERINYLPNERKNDLPQQVTKHDGRKTTKLEESGFPQATESQDG